MSPTARTGLLAFGIVGVVFLIPLGLFGVMLANRAQDKTQVDDRQNARGTTSTDARRGEQTPELPLDAKKALEKSETNESPPSTKMGSDWDLDDVVVYVRRTVSPSLRTLDRALDSTGNWISAIGDDGVGFAVYKCVSAAASANMATRVKNGWSWGRFCFSFCVTSDVASANRVIASLDPSGIRFKQLSPTFSEELGKIADDAVARRKEQARQGADEEDRRRRAEKSMADEVLSSRHDPNEEKQGIDAKALGNHRWWNKPLTEKEFESLVNAVQESKADTEIWFDRDRWFVTKRYATRAPQDRRLESTYPEFTDRMRRAVDMVMVYKSREGPMPRDLVLGKFFAALERGVTKLGPAIR